MSVVQNPILNSDFPDPDIIRVGHTYYMASTTMHFMPGCDILRSFDLTHWEPYGHVYHTLGHTGTYMLDDDQDLYGQGMWAPSLRWHNGRFHVLFSANDTHTTHLFTAEDARGPWRHHIVQGFYHDPSLLFDDGRVFIVHGNTALRLTEMEVDLSGPKAGGLDRVLVQDLPNQDLGYEGSHLQRHDGRYYLFTCHFARGHRKTEDCFIADSLDGEFRGRCILDDDLGYHDQGVAQGGMVDTPDGQWYAFMFQDRGALGRTPVLMPMHFDTDGMPVLGVNGRVPAYVESAPSAEPHHHYAPLNGDDDFRYTPDSRGTIHLAPYWQFNHTPHDETWSVTARPGAFRITTSRVSATMLRATNTLTQRTTGPRCAAEVTIDASGLMEGDIAGLCAFQGCYAYAAITRRQGSWHAIMAERNALHPDNTAERHYDEIPVEVESLPLPSPQVTFRLEIDYTDMRDTARFLVRTDAGWIPIGHPHRLWFKLDHFTGCRFALFTQATQHVGGHADFMRFRYHDATDMGA